MNEKWLAIVRFLCNQDDWVTSFSMSAFLNISVRTVKSYVQDVNHFAPGLIESSRNGFRISDKAAAAALMHQAKGNQVPQNAKDRQKFILRRLLLEKDPCSLEKLASQLCVSYATLVNELPKLKEELADYELVFRTKQDLAYLEGAEAHKKKLLSLLIYEDTQGAFLSLKQIQKHLPSYDLAEVRLIVNETLRNHHYFVDDISLVNLVMHIGIMMERKQISGGQIEEGERQWEALVQGHVLQIVQDITGEIARRFHVIFTDSEEYDLALLVMTRAISEKISEVDFHQLSAFVSEDVLALVKSMQRRVKEEFSISITNPDFTVRFSLHIRNLLLRLEHGVVLRNPQMKNIKRTYPFLYDVAVFLANMITRERGFTLTEDEIAYIALHIGVLLEERRLMKNEVRAILLTTQYFGQHDMSERISAVFQDNLLLIGVISDEDELERFTDYDLLITTAPLREAVDKPSVQIAHHLSNRDVLQVTRRVEDILKARTKTKVESKLRTMFKETLFFFGQPWTNRQEAISAMADALERDGYVGSDFKGKLFERETVSSSAYTNIAMPHPLEMCAAKSGIAVSIHPNPIAWNDDTRVNIVFMLAIRPEDSLFFKDIFEFITEVISEEAKLRRLLECRTFDHFIDLLVDFAK